MSGALKNFKISYTPMGLETFENYAASNITELRIQFSYR